MPFLSSRRLTAVARFSPCSAVLRMVHRLSTPLLPPSHRLLTWISWPYFGVSSFSGRCVFHQTASLLPLSKTRRPHYVSGCTATPRSW